MRHLAESMGIEVGLFKRLHWGMLLAVAGILLMGELFIYSAGIASQSPLFVKQTVWVAIGLLCYVVLAGMDYRLWVSMAWLLYGVTVGLLILVLFVGTEIDGGRRWLMLFGTISVQPSEFAKVATILLLSARLNRTSLGLEGFWFWMVTMALVGIPVLLTAAQPDFGTALVFVPIMLVMFFIAGCRKRILFLLLGLMVGAAGFMVSCLLLPEKLGASPETQKIIINAFGMKEYHQNRLRVFLDPELDPMDTGWHMTQSKIAVGSGGLTGKGYMQGTQNVLGFLPVSTTDFIFSVIAEEAGFLGSLGLLLLFAALLYFSVRTAMKSRDKIGRILCSGFVSLLFVHVFVNISMTVGLLPVIGVPLPLLSYGGSSMITVMASLGLLQSVWIRSKSSVEEFDE